MTAAMKASFLLVTYKHEAFIAEAIRSAMAQDYPQLELVVCDDGSPDRTREILEKELENCPPHIEVVWASQKENRGFHENFNCGLKSCTGDVIVVMSGDDVSVPHRVSTICREFAADPDCMLVCSDWIRIDESGKDLGIRGRKRKCQTFAYSITSDHIYAKAPICGAVAAYRASLCSLFPPMEKGAHAEDNCFWVRALLAGNIHYLSEPLVFWRTHGQNQRNRIRTQDFTLVRDKHLEFLWSQQCIGRQWTRDLHHAMGTNLISREKHEQLTLTGRIHCEWYRLLRLSITGAPWRLWLGSASVLIRAGITAGSFRKSTSRILRKNLTLRLSARQRDAYWRSHCAGKST